ncbi:MAG: pseudouridine synthase, partial [Gemmatimonadaceae bacterium]
MSRDASGAVDALAPGAYTFGIADGGERLDLAVARLTGRSRTQAATLIATGQVQVDGRAEKASLRLEPGMTLAVTIPAPVGRAIVAEAIPLRVAYEDEDVVVVDKPAGMVVHPAPGHWSGTLVNALLGRGQALAAGGGAERVGLVHRLDKETSGLLIVAKTDRAHAVLSGALAARTITRRYAALCWGHLDADEVRVDQP